MNIALERIIEGIIATLRSDVIPHVGDSYAKGQAIGVIDLLNAVAPRIEWARQPLQARVSARIEALAAATDKLGEPGPRPAGFDVASASTGELMAELDRLDGVISDLLRALTETGNAEGPRAEALALLKTHVHEDISAEMKRTRKPLFAEIASGGAGAKPD